MGSLVDRVHPADTWLGDRAWRGQRVQDLIDAALKAIMLSEAYSISFPGTETPTHPDTTDENVDEYQTDREIRSDRRQLMVPQSPVDPEKSANSASERTLHPDLQRTMDLYDGLLYVFGQDCFQI